MTRQPKKIGYEHKGLVCPNCGCQDFKVRISRPDVNNTVYRYRRCRNCAFHIHTNETIDYKRSGLD